MSDYRFMKDMNCFKYLEPEWEEKDWGRYGDREFKFSKSTQAWSATSIRFRRINKESVAINKWSTNISCCMKIAERTENE